MLGTHYGSKTLTKRMAVIVGEYARLEWRVACESREGAT
jgi:hypothetical protein